MPNSVAMSEGNEEPKTLLDVLEAEYNRNKDSRTSRLMMVAEINKAGGTSDDDVLSFHQEFVESHTGEDEISGLLVAVNHNTIAHVLEAPTKVLMDLLRVFGTTSSKRKDEKKPTAPLLCNIRVASFTEEVIREYPLWTGRKFKAQEEGEYQPANYLDATFNIYKDLLELGHEVRSMKSRVKQYLHGLKPQVVGRLPSSEKLAALAKSDELCSVDEFLEVYDKPIEHTLESEEVWPVEPYLKVSPTFQFYAFGVLCAFVYVLCCLCKKKNRSSYSLRPNILNSHHFLPIAVLSKLSIPSVLMAARPIRRSPIPPMRMYFKLDFFCSFYNFDCLTA